MVNFEISCEIKKDQTHYVMNMRLRKKKMLGIKPLTTGIDFFLVSLSIMK